ncbi:MAG: GNAT family N-acetyltransferase [Puniceicoccales bacterium]|jgi:GNAT superfamily N-acetyltransferase|nr:GNAT family N-acetyltransferase [Puniceicoccales bacterium]
MSQNIEIIPYSAEHREAVRRLNYEWIERYFYIEADDARILADPQKEILDKGGFIFFAQMDSAIIGTVSLLRQTDTLFEIGKMAVTESAQGLGAGGLLFAHCVRFARAHGVEKLVLYSNRSLLAALRVYRKYGFVEVPLESGHYARADIKMELNLKTSPS